MTAPAEDRGPTLLAWFSERARALLRAMNHGWLLLAFATPFLVFFYVKATLPLDAPSADVANSAYEATAADQSVPAVTETDPSPEAGSSPGAEPPAAGEDPAVTAQSTSGAGPNWGGLPFSDIAAKWLAIISSVMFFGALGSTVSIYARTSPGQERDDRKRTLIGGQILGAVFATLLFLSFIGGLVQGSIFPLIAVGPWDQMHFTLESWAKLLVWSFIAGFSERFVPDLLSNFTLRGSAKPEADT